MNGNDLCNFVTGSNVGFKDLKYEIGLFNYFYNILELIPTELQIITFLFYDLLSGES